MAPLKEQLLGKIFGSSSAESKIVLAQSIAGKYAENGGLALQILQDVDEIQEIVPLWQDIVQKAPGARLFESPLWIINYWKFRNEQNRVLTLLVGRVENRIVGVFPLCQQSGRLPPFTSNWSLVHSTGEYESGWFCHPDYCGDFSQSILNYLVQNKSRWFKTTINTIPEGSLALPAICTDCKESRLSYHILPDRLVPYLSTSLEICHIDDTLDGKYRREIRRREKKLQESGPVHTEVYLDRIGLDRALDEFFMVEAAGWKGTAGSAIQKLSATKEFWRTLATDAADAGLLRLHILRCGESPIAGQLGIVFGRTYYCLKLGYDENYRQYGPGALTTRSAIQHCIEDPTVDVYDFAGPAMPYMQHWTNRTYQTWTLNIGTPHPLAGFVYNGLQVGRRCLRTCRQAIINRKS